MKPGTKTLLFGVHQFILHPFFVFIAWIALYKQLPSLSQFIAICVHNWGLWGKPNLDGEEGEEHPKIMYDYFNKKSNKHFFKRTKYSVFSIKYDYHYTFYRLYKNIANEIIGHSRFYAQKYNKELSKLFYADKLSIIFYPKILYVLLGTLSGEINEYMSLCDNGKYNCINNKSKITWLLETQTQMTLMGLGKYGNNYTSIKNNLT